MVVEDVVSSHGESVNHVAGAGERDVSHNALDVPVEKLEGSEEDARLANFFKLRSFLHFYWSTRFYRFMLSLITVYSL